MGEIRGAHALPNRFNVPRETFMQSRSREGFFMSRRVSVGEGEMRDDDFSPFVSGVKIRPRLGGRDVSLFFFRVRIG